MDATQTTTEVWRLVPTAPGYEVSSTGNVRSVDRVLDDGRHWAGRPMHPTLGKRGYYVVTLRYAGTRKVRTVHSLVAKAFHGPADGRLVRHLNGIHTDNRAENLRWGTQSENMHDTVEHGRNHWANKTHCPSGHAYSEFGYSIPSRPTARYCEACQRARRV